MIGRSSSDAPRPPLCAGWSMPMALSPWRNSPPPWKTRTRISWPACGRGLLARREMCMRRRTWLLPLLIATPVLLLCLARRPAGGETGLPGDQHSLPLWVLACCAVLVRAALARLSASAARQRARTERALAPPLSLPHVAAPAPLAGLLQALRLEVLTQVIDLVTPVALCHGLLRPRLLFSTGILAGLSAAELE